MKPADLIRVLDDPDLPGITEQDAQSELLLTLVAHLFFADGRLERGEIELVQRLIPPSLDASSYIEELTKRPLDLARIAEEFPDPQDRDDVVTLAEHAVWGDDDVDSREWDLVDQLVEALGVDRD
jgi:uncharacterized membrane protein YebE (DUF533 family)